MDPVVDTQAGRAWLGYLCLSALLTGAYVFASLFGPDWLHSGLVFNLLGGLSIAALMVDEDQRAAPAAALVPARARPDDVRDKRRAGLQLRAPVRHAAQLSLGGLTRSILAFYPFLVGGMLLLIHERDEGRDRSALLDALTVTLALATLLWVYLISPYADGHSMSPFARLTSIGYPAMDILVIGVLADGRRRPARREPAFVFMLSGVVVLLLSDAIYCWRLLESHFTPGPVTMAGWAILYALLGAAAMHPSMRRLAEPGPRSSSTLTRARLALLACAKHDGAARDRAAQTLGERLDLYVLIGASAAARCSRWCCCAWPGSCAATRRSPGVRRRCASSWPNRRSTSARRRASRRSWRTPPT